MKKPKWFAGYKDEEIDQREARVRRDMAHTPAKWATHIAFRDYCECFMDREEMKEREYHRGLAAHVRGHGKPAYAWKIANGVVTRITLKRKEERGVENGT